MKYSCPHLLLITLLSQALFLCSLYAARSPHRPAQSWYPSIITRWTDEKVTYSLESTHLEEYPFFDVFDKKYFETHILPHEKITFRNHPEKSVDGTILSNLIEGLLKEVDQGKKRFTHFKVLKDDDFNHHMGWGLIIAKFKDYPFVVKLSFETPEGITRPESHGFIPLFFFYLGGGVNRHITGFTRVSNSYSVKQRIAMDPAWADRVEVPRKWFWLPQKPRWIEIRGNNLGGKSNQRTEIPGVYAVIADAIESTHTLSVKKAEDRALAMELSGFLELQVDPHIDNYMFEKGTGKIVIIDTEHFPTVAGYREPHHYDSYLGWYAGLISKCSKDMIFQTKKEAKLKASTPTKRCRGSWCQA